MKCYRAAILLFIFVVVSGCSSLLYQPSQRRFADPKALPHPPNEVRIPDGHGVELLAWHFKSPKAPPKGQIVFFHGNGENLSSHFTALFWILQHGYDFLVFDYRGYGITSGEPNPENTVQAGLAVSRWLKHQSPQLPLIVYGQSLGGAVALKTMIDYQSEIKSCAIVVDSSFLSYQEAARALLAKSWTTWWLQPITYLVLSDQWAPKKDVSKLTPTPLLVIHGKQDPIVPAELGEKIYQAAQQPKEFWAIPSGLHIDTLSGPNRNIYRPQFLNYLETHCGQGKP